MEKIDVLIIGQGIAGTLLGHELLKKGLTIKVVDNGASHTASKAAAAIINPMAGKHWRMAADAASLLQTATETYAELSHLLEIPVLEAMPMWVFPQGHGELNALQLAAKAHPAIVHFDETKKPEPCFHSEFPVAVVSKTFRVNNAALLASWRQFLCARNLLLPEYFDISKAEIGNHEIVYNQIKAAKIVFCEGAATQTQQLFPSLPFTQNRGDVMLLDIPNLPKHCIYQGAARLVHLHQDKWWCGSNYAWQFHDLKPDVAWRNNTMENLGKWLKLPFQITDHRVAQRPTTAGQKPLLLRHTAYRNVLLFNGLGTRGFSGGPALAKQMAAMVMR
ncbi:MAG: FAD-dependent oxidoreductase [Edaphocola sp.]